MLLSAYYAVSCTSLRNKHAQTTAVPSGRLLHETACEVNHMHAKGKVHRDVKAGNIRVGIANPVYTTLYIRIYLTLDPSGVSPGWECCPNFV